MTTLLTDLRRMMELLEKIWPGPITTEGRYCIDGDQVFFASATDCDEAEIIAARQQESRDERG